MMDTWNMAVFKANQSCATAEATDRRTNRPYDRRTDLVTNDQTERWDGANRVTLHGQPRYVTWATFTLQRKKSYIIAKQRGQPLGDKQRAHYISDDDIINLKRRKNDGALSA